jgi:hypothetical protein
MRTNGLIDTGTKASLVSSDIYFFRENDCIKKCVVRTVTHLINTAVSMFFFKEKLHMLHL